MEGRAGEREKISGCHHSKEEWVGMERWTDWGFACTERAFDKAVATAPNVGACRGRRIDARARPTERGRGKYRYLGARRVRKAVSGKQRLLAEENRRRDGRLEGWMNDTDKTPRQKTEGAPQTIQTVVRHTDTIGTMPTQRWQREETQGDRTPTADYPLSSAESCVPQKRRVNYSTPLTEPSTKGTCSSSSPVPVPPVPPPVKLSSSSPSEPPEDCSDWTLGTATSPTERTER